MLLGPRTGDNNQALALAEALGLPFETKHLAYNRLQALSVWLPGTALTLDRESRTQLRPPWPDLVIAIGRRSVPVARWIKRHNKGQTKLVRIGHPRVDPGLFDLVITTRQYPVPPGDNVLLLPLAMSRFATPPGPTAVANVCVNKNGPHKPAMPRRLCSAPCSWPCSPASTRRVMSACELGPAKPHSALTGKPSRNTNVLGARP